MSYQAGRALSAGHTPTEDDAWLGSGELQPEGAASIIDTDLEVDVLPSVEFEEAMRAEARRFLDAL